jgi:O-antigen/teichoic acid export membrane protein
MKNNFSYQAFLLMAAKALDVMGLTVLGMIFSRVLTIEDYGTYRQVWLLYNTLIPLFTLGISTSINYFVPRLSTEQQKTFIFQTFFSLFTLGLIFAVFLYIGANYLGARLNNPTLGQVIKVFALIPLLTMPTSYYHNLYICIKKAVLAAAILSLSTLVRFSVIAAAIYVNPSLENIFKAFLLYYIAEFVVLTLLIFRPFRQVPLHLKHQNLLEQLKFTVPIGMSSMIGTINRQIDKIIISGQFTVREFAIYSNGATELPIARILNSAVMSVIMPELVRLYSQGEYKRLLELWHRSIRKVSLIILPMMVFMFVFAREFLLFLYSEKYLDSSGIFQIYLLTLPNRVTTFGSVLLAAGLSKIIMYYNAYTVIIAVVLNILLIKLLGVWGAAIGTILSIYFITFIQLKKICFVVNCTFKEVYPWRLTLNILLVALASIIIPCLIKPLVPNYLVCLALNGVIYLFIYTCAAVWTKLLSDSEIEQIKKRVGWVLKCWPLK